MDVSTTTKKNIKITDSLLVKVQSGFYGRLCYVNKRSGETVIWAEQGDIQVMPISELRDMKGQQPQFFSNQWVLILGVAEGEDLRITAEDICKYLVVNQYYNAINPNTFREAHNWSDAEISRNISLMSEGTKEILRNVIADLIRDGQLDSRKKIRLFSELLDTNFDDK